MTRKILVLFLMAFTAVCVFAADATGKWTGTLHFVGPDGSEQDRPAYLVLEQEGPRLTGTAGPDASEQTEIDEGKAEDGRLTFSVRSKSIKFDLKHEGDAITGEVTRERDGQTQKASLSVKRGI